MNMITTIELVCESLKRIIDQVKGLLVNSAMNISEIAKASGYSDPGYMRRIFIKRFNTSPRTYRSQALHFND
jgi:two-component system, response regulator YesN